MPNMLDYLAWRGDLSIDQDAINENDELILSQLAYVAFGQYIPSFQDGRKPVRLHDAVSWLLDFDPAGERIHQTGFMWKNNLKLLEALRDSRRFGDMELMGYVDSISPEDEKQFAAMSVALGDDTTLVAFRGTDDTLVGWKEDLSMAYNCPVPAQREAAQYLEEAAARTRGSLRVSGHSKGGNLAIYAASHCPAPVEERLITVVSHDGPGLDQGTLKSEGYARIRGRLRVYIPHFSFVGMLLEHENNYTVVQSDANTILQHDAFSWQMRGRQMLYADRPSEQSLNTNRIIRQWMHTLSEDEQRLFVEAVYEVASATYGDKLPDDLEKNWPQNVQSIFTAMLNLEPKTRALFRKGLGELFSTAVRNFRFPWQRESEAERLELEEALLDTMRTEELP